MTPPRTTETATTELRAHVFQLRLLLVSENLIELGFDFFVQGFELFFLVARQVELVGDEGRNGVELAVAMWTATRTAGTAALSATGTLSAFTGRLIIRLSLEQARRCAECQRDEYALYFHGMTSLLFFSAPAVRIDAMQYKRRLERRRT